MEVIFSYYAVFVSSGGFLGRRWRVECSFGVCKVGVIEGCGFRGIGL